MRHHCWGPATADRMATTWKGRKIVQVYRMSAVETRKEAAQVQFRYWTAQAWINIQAYKSYISAASITSSYCAAAGRQYNINLPPCVTYNSLQLMPARCHDRGKRNSALGLYSPRAYVSNRLSLLFAGKTHFRHKCTRVKK